MAKRPRKHTGDRFVKLTFHMLNHPHYKQLSAIAKVVYTEIRRRYNGENNGNISLSCREAGEVAGCSKDTAQRAIIELEYYGFIIRRVVGTFGNRHASEFILTCEMYNNRPPTHEWKESRKALKKITRHTIKDIQSQIKDRTTMMEQQIVSGE